jgi:hypothetical protein
LRMRALRIAARQSRRNLYTISIGIERDTFIVAVPRSARAI